jgi:uncharacterized protein YjbK
MFVDKINQIEVEATVTIKLKDYEMLVDKARQPENVFMALLRLEEKLKSQEITIGTPNSITVLKKISKESEHNIGNIILDYLRYSNVNLV